jgi:hypothetical protein
MQIIARDDPAPADDEIVVIHMGAGAVEVAVVAALRNYRSYAPFSTRGGEFPVSVFAAMAGVTEAMILGAMPHPQYGRARYGAIRNRFALLPTTILGTPVPDEVMSVHFDIVLPTASLELAADFDPSEAADELVERIRTVLNASAAELLALFEPRLRR